MFDGLHSANQRLLERAQGVSVAKLRQAYQLLEQEYRSTGPVPALNDELACLVYALVRLPATSSVLYRILAELLRRDPLFAPASLLDFGSGPGSLPLVASSLWPELAIQAIERERAFEALARATCAPSSDLTWHVGEFSSLPPSFGSFDLVTTAYVVNELPESAKQALLERMIASASGYLLVVEPGTRAGFANILTCRKRLIEEGFFVVAPCAASVTCPSEWCHFSLKVPRTKIHRQIKGGGFEL